jgi:hypothetical protein
MAQRPHTDNSAKSLSQAILPNLWHRQFCQITGTLLHKLPNHWHRQFCQITDMLITGTLSTDRQFCQITGTGNSAKSLACSSTCGLFCQITGTLSTDRQFCQITGTGNSARISLAQCPHTDYSAKSLEHSSKNWLFCKINGTLSTYRQFCQITVTGSSSKSLAEAIMTNHWQSPPHAGNSAKSLAHCVHRKTILPNHLHR